MSDNKVHPFPLDSRVRSKQHGIEGIVEGTWHGARGVRVSVEYLDRGGVVRSTYIDAEQLEPVVAAAS
jgi:hypothetical protein